MVGWRVLHNSWVPYQSLQLSSSYKYQQERWRGNIYLPDFLRTMSKETAKWIMIYLGHLICVLYCLFNFILFVNGLMWTVRLFIQIGLNFLIFIHLLIFYLLYLVYIYFASASSERKRERAVGRGHRMLQEEAPPIWQWPLDHNHSWANNHPQLHSKAVYSYSHTHHKGGSINKKVSFIRNKNSWLPRCHDPTRSKHSAAKCRWIPGGAAHLWLPLPYYALLNSYVTRKYVN